MYISCAVQGICLYFRQGTQLPIDIVVYVRAIFYVSIFYTSFVSYFPSKRRGLSRRWRRFEGGNCFPCFFLSFSFSLLGHAWNERTTALDIVSKNVQYLNFVLNRIDFFDVFEISHQSVRYFWITELSIYHVAHISPFSPPPDMFMLWCWTKRFNVSTTTSIDNRIYICVLFVYRYGIRDTYARGTYQSTLVRHTSLADMHRWAFF